MPIGDEWYVRANNTTTNNKQFMLTSLGGEDRVRESNLSTKSIVRALCNVCAIFIELVINPASGVVHALLDVPSAGPQPGRTRRAGSREGW